MRLMSPEWIPLLKIHQLSVQTIFQAVAGEVPLILAGPVVGETALSDPFQCVGSGVQSDSVLGGSLLLPSAASDRDCHTDGQLLHPKGCLGPSINNIFLSPCHKMSKSNDLKR